MAFWFIELKLKRAKEKQGAEILFLLPVHSLEA